MKFIKIWAIAVVSFVFCCNAARQDGAFIGSLRFPSTITKAPDMKILYKGRVVDVEMDEINQGIGHIASFQISEDKECKELYVLITQDLKKPSENNFTKFQTSAKHPYRFFRLRKNKFFQENAEGKNELQESWLVQEYTEHKDTIDLPDNTLIIFINPEHIETLESVAVKSGSLLRLPEIVFKDSIGQTEIDDIGVKMELALVNLKPFHTRPAKRVLQVAKNHSISLDYGTV